MDPEIKIEKATPQGCGIEEYFHKHESFTGDIKTMASDFIVREVTREGKVLKITKNKEEIDMLLVEAPMPTIIPPDFVELLSEEDSNKVTELMENDKLKKVELEAGDKAQRTKFHELVREYFPKFDSSFDLKNNKLILKRVGKKEVRYQGSDPQFVHFTLAKKNLDTFTALTRLGKPIWRDGHKFTYCGVKDKVGVTVQRVCAKRVTFEKLIQAASHSRDIVISDFEKLDYPLALGAHSANQFNLVLRNTSATPQLLEKALEDVATGIPNYFGIQRFGTFDVPTHSIGAAIIAGEWNTAFDLLMTPCQQENSSIQAVKQKYLDTHDPHQTLELLNKLSLDIPRAFSEDIRRQLDALIGALATNNESDKIYKICFDMINRNMRSMYCHAYQSYLFNKALSARIRMSHEICIGDIIKEDDKFIYVTEDNIKKYSISDVYLPLYCDPETTILPKNESGELIKKMLINNSVDLEKGFYTHLSEGEVQKQYNIGGDYRKILIIPTELSASIREYEDPQHDFCLDDMSFYNSISEAKEENCTKKALVVSVTLPSSSYATVFLREFLQDEKSDRE